MTPAATLLATLRPRGVCLEAHGDRLRIEPASRVTPAEMAALREHKPALLALLGLAADLEREGEGDRVRAVYETLSDAERGRLEGEARAGDPVAAVMLLLVLPAHGGDA